MTTAWRGPGIVSTYDRRGSENVARNRFIRARSTLGLTQEGAAALLDASAKTVGTWECGRARLPGWALVAIEATAERAEALVA